MGLTSSSTGSKILKEDSILKYKYDFRVALGGNPNVGKSTIFNSLTGMNQHTGNWAGKTVETSSGSCSYLNKNFLFVDLPGTYSLISNSEEEEIARDFICFENPDVTVIVLDATCLERQLNLVYQTMELTKNLIVCVNLLDEAKKNGINIDLELLSKRLGVPVVGAIARKKKTLNKLLDTVYKVCMKKIAPSPILVEYPTIIEDSVEKITNILKKSYLLPEYLYRWISLKILDDNDDILSSIQKRFSVNLEKNNLRKIKESCLSEMLEHNVGAFKDIVISQIIKNAENITKEVCSFGSKSNSNRNDIIDKILTSKTFGIPIMLIFLALIFWITIVGANYPSQTLFKFFAFIQEKLLIKAATFGVPKWLSDMLILGIYQTVTWIVSVMLPPMAIFFPLFTILEDLGFLPRIAFNLDKFFKKAATSGKQMITMCMGFGCNACGVTGCRIIDSPRERLIAILTNSFVPCNGRYPILITIASIFIAHGISDFASSILSTLAVVFVILLGILLSLLISKILSKTILKGLPSSFILELPPYRKPQFGKIFVRSIFDRTLFVLGRALIVAAPAGLIIWLFANIGFNGISLLTYIANFLNPFAQLLGLDGYILTAFIFGIPANEIVLPIILMCYLGGNSLSNISDTLEISNILKANGWNILTAINMMIFTVLHFPCTTTLLTVKKETGKWKWTCLAFVLPTICGIIICMGTSLVYNVFNSMF